MTDTSRYYVIDLAPQHRVFLAWEDGERVERAFRQRDEDPLCFTDLSGSVTSIARDSVIWIYGSTPEIRARDHELSEQREAERKQHERPEWER